MTKQIPQGVWPWLRTAAAFCLLAAPAHATVQCNLPSAFQLRIEQREDGKEAGRKAAATPATDSASVLYVGDRILQVNGQRVRSCADLESAAAEALAKGLALLLAVERDGQLVSMAVESTLARAAAEPATTKTYTVVEVAWLATGVALVALDIAYGHGRHGPINPFGPFVRARKPEPAGVEITATPADDPPARGVQLPPPVDASPALRQSTADAAAALGGLARYARLSLPMAVYEQHLEETEDRIETLPFGTDDNSVAVHAAVDTILGYHRTARDIRRTKIAYLNRVGRDVRAAARFVPYFSDSEVPHWLARYPFLHESLEASPLAFGSFGERAGNWDPDRATDILWEHAREDTAKLATWAGGLGSLAPRAEGGP